VQGSQVICPSRGPGPATKHDRLVRSIFLRSGNRRKAATFDLCGEGGRPDRSVRSAGPIDFGNDRSDPPVSSERPREIPVGELQQKRPPRPIPAIDRSDRFFCGATGWGRGATGFLEVGVIDHDAGKDSESCRWGLTAPIPPRERDRCRH
jgi:hypothetical protein